jgi:RNA 3'-terminal phosphate cyclase (ATP)
MISINGAAGEGGGQVVRNACALSLVTGQSFRVTNIRGGRAKPGLMRQHVTALEAACAISGSDCIGLAVGASDIEFRPGKVTPGDYQFAVGTAGSTSLVLQTLLMPLILADAPSRLVLEGGTHNAMAPPFDFIQRTFLPLINRMGPAVTARLVRHGFYPRGGGRIEVDIIPAPLQRMDCIDRGAPTGVTAEVVFCGLPFDVADRMLARARRDLTAWPYEAFTVRQLSGDEGPGVILMLEARYGQVTELVSGFGQLGVSAERLAKTAAARMQGYVQSTAFAGPYLADQLILPFVLAGGSLTTVKPSQHLLTAIDIARMFTARSINLTRQSGGGHLLDIV